MAEYSDKLAIDLTLYLGAKTRKIAAGNIRTFELDADLFGFNARVGFWLDADGDDDKLFTSLLQPDRVDVLLAFQSSIDPPDKAKPISARGIVVGKSFTEHTHYDVKDQPILSRFVELSFADAASILWREHFPYDLKVSVTMKDILEEHCMEGIKLDMDWSTLEKTEPLIALPMTPDHRCSFYDFVLWYTDLNDGVFSYDCMTNTYSLTGDKASPKDEELSLRLVDGFYIMQGRVPRHDVKIYNASVDDARNAEVEQDHSVSGVRHDYLLRTKVANDFDNRKSKESKRLKTPLNHVQFAPRTHPWISILPGSSVKLVDEDPSKNAWALKKSFRVIAFQVKAKASVWDAEHEKNSDELKCSVEMAVEMEEKADDFIQLPAFTPPTFPFDAEGTVISEVGDESDTSYNIYRDRDTSLDFYKIHVPLWNKEVMVPFESDYLPPHFYFPAYRGARVLLSFSFNGAEIRRFIDFGPRVRTPEESQGNQLLLGLNEQSQTAISHMYLNNKPILDIERVTEGQSELIRFSDGSILIQTESDESGISSGSGTNLTAQVEAAKAELYLKTQAGISDATAAYEGAADDLKQNINSTSGECQSTMEEAEGAIEGKASEATGVAESAMGQVDEQTAALSSSFGDAKAELESQISL